MNHHSLRHPLVRGGVIKKFLNILWLILLVGCMHQPDQIQVTPVPTFTPEPSPVPTKPTLGSEGNPIIVGLVPNTDDIWLEEIRSNLEEFLLQGTGQSIEVKTFPNYTVLLSQMRSGNAHVFFLQALTYLYAQENGLAEAAMLLSHYGLYEYATQFLINKGSGIFPYFNPNGQENLGDAAAALTQLQGKRPCWTTSSSISGYLLPKGILEINNISLQDEIYMQTYNASIRALYISGICDFAATYAHSGDPRTSSTIQSELPDVLDRVVILWQSDPIIPYLNISYHPNIPPLIKQSLTTSFLVFIDTQNGKEHLSLLNGFQIDGGKIIDDTYYDPLRTFVDILKEDPVQFIGY